MHNSLRRRTRLWVHTVFGHRPELVTQRLLDALPGALFWLMLPVMLTLTLVVPRVALLLGGAIALYSALRFLLAAGFYLRGLALIARDTATDWRARYDAEAGPDAIPWERVQHVVVIPNYDEPEPILRRTLKRIAAAPQARSQITVVLAMESAEPNCETKAARLQAEFQGCFAAVYVTVHPQNLPGEIRSKSANLRWASRWIQAELIEGRRLNRDHTVITTMDADTLWHERYFEALTYAFATDPARYMQFWQAPVRYHANVHEAHPWMRLVNAYSNGMELAYLAAPVWWDLPISSYSLSWCLLETSGGWDGDVIADEPHMYIKAFFKQGGQVSIKPLFLPFLGTIVTGATLREVCRNRYRQSLRHAWGTKEIGYVLRLLRGRRGPFRRSPLRLLVRVSHDIALTSTGWLLMTLGTQLPLWLHADLRAEILALASPWFIALQAIFLLMTLLLLFFLGMDTRTRPAHGRPSVPGERLTTLVGVLLLPVLAAVFLVLPLIHAQTRLMLGRRLPFEVTAKIQHTERRDREAA
jgi:hypothetical protein